ncbi:hypothetical protein BV898_00183 [Hypsibius exemplaris]|uniref:Uncharacterized protein n=1 Tax=Hypsibius exemplaris TaxID=2072580 RepID=A0A1W0XF05_HYPEX|nr:hypothetical protein BV898_00183 [Hypsibius exemplaris]
MISFHDCPRLYPSRDNGYLEVNFTFRKYCPIFTSYGTGDTIISTSHANGGPKTALVKWQVECLDGEAVVGVQDAVFDFGGVVNVWCKFIFPYKVAQTGLYPYYPNCHVKNYKNQFFCYDPQNHTLTTNTFITGLWDDDASFWVYRTPVDDQQLYKCCRVPPGYYIDYVSCYYMLSHDQYWEYYDSNFFLMMCSTGYVMTGISKKKSPINAEFRIEWIQCCRIGYGKVTALPPPTIQTPNGGPTAYSTNHAYNSPATIPQDYAHQYRGKRSTVFNTAIETGRHSMLTAEEALPGDASTIQSNLLNEGSKKPPREPFDFSAAKQQRRLNVPTFM